MKAARWAGGMAMAGVDAAFPASCASCRAPVESGPLPHVCEDCARPIQIVADPRCLTCGFPLFGEAESVAFCSHCEGLEPVFGRGFAIALFRGAVRDLVYALKYEGGLWALRDLNALAERSAGLGDYLAGATLVPVPLHPRKLRERGYNQSALIAREIASLFPECRVEEALVRGIDTPSQTRFNRQERRRNLRNAFSTKSKSAIASAPRIIVVDDVFTTGSTLNACAAALLKGGAQRVDVLTIGHG